MAGMALQWRTVSTTGGPTFVRQPHYGRAASRAKVRVCASFLNPHSILGVSPTADVKEVKRAYRKLALQYHPDVCKSEEGHERFITLTQAYEMLLGRAEGKTDPNYASSSGWDFHDWYWNFRMQRSWEHQQRQAKAAAADGGSRGSAGGEPPEGFAGGGAEATGGRRPPPHGHAGFQQPEARANLRNQLAGLRHRAAVRANRPQPPGATSPSPETWSAASGWSMEAEAEGAAAAASGPLPSWSWSWTWDETSESEDEQGTAAAASPSTPAVSVGTADAVDAANLHHQYTHVYDSAAGTAAAAGPGSGGGSADRVGQVVVTEGPPHPPPPPMSFHDGHLGTVVANHAVPFPSGGFSSVGKLQHQQQHSPPQPQHRQEAAHGELRQQRHQQQREEEHALQYELEPEPFSNPFDRAPPHQQPHGAARRRFNADSATREAVSHQLTGLRRKAAIKGRGWAGAASAEGGGGV